MRRLFLILMIVMLPLRGWAGDLMGVRMAANSAVETAATAVMPPDCPMHQQAAQSGMSADGEAADAAPAHGDTMKNCASCELCIPMAALACTRLDVVMSATHVQPPMLGADFLSATLAPSVKPPIF